MSSNAQVNLGEVCGPSIVTSQLPLHCEKSWCRDDGWHVCCSIKASGCLNVTAMWAPWSRWPVYLSALSVVYLFPQVHVALVGLCKKLQMRFIILESHIGLDANCFAHLFWVSTSSGISLNNSIEISLSSVYCMYVFLFSGLKGKTDSQLERNIRIKEEDTQHKNVSFICWDGRLAPLSNHTEMSDLSFTSQTTSIYVRFLC